FLNRDQRVQFAVRFGIVTMVTKCKTAAFDTMAARQRRCGCSVGCVLRFVTAVTKSESGCDFQIGTRRRFGCFLHFMSVDIKSESAANEGKSQSSIARCLLFGRFLNFSTTVLKCELPADFTEGRFRGACDLDVF